MTLPTAAAERLARITAEAAPRRLLGLGAATLPLLERHAEQMPGGYRQHLVDPAGLAALGRFDLAVAADILEPMDRRHGEQLLARLRDLHTARIALLVRGGDQAEAWPTNALLALGLTRLAADGNWRLFGYDLARYKTTPDWLNANFWANPEMWDKAWW